MIGIVENVSPCSLMVVVCLLTVIVIATLVLKAVCHTVNAEKWNFGS